MTIAESADTPTESKNVSLPCVLPLRLFVTGRARTKGSMRPEGRLASGGVRLVEQVAGSKAWRELVAETVLRYCGATPSPAGPVLAWEPFTGPVMVGLTVWLPRPAGVSQPFPTRRTDGDLDKFARNVGDALQDTRVIVDDSQIVHWSAWKAWTPEGGVSGIQLDVVRAPVPGWT